MGDNYKLPPRKRDWRKGIPQIGIFIRTEKGSTITMIHDQATEDEAMIVWHLIRGVHQVPDAALKQLRKIYREHIDS